jgi:hypothetical protein
MKAIAIAVLALSVSAYAQVNQTSHGQNSPNINNVKGDVNIPAHPQTPAPQPTPVEPKHSEATANLALAEEKKVNLQMRQQLIVQQANQQLTQIRNELGEQEKASAEAIKQVKKENDFGDDVNYVPPTQQPDGTVAAGHWQKMPAKREK